MPLSKGIKKFFQRRKKKPQSSLQGSVQGSVRHSARKGSSSYSASGKISWSQGTEASTSSQLNPDRSEAELSRESVPYEESIVEEVSAEEETDSSEAAATNKTPEAPIAMASNAKHAGRRGSGRRGSGRRGSGNSTENSVDEVPPLPGDRRHSLNSATTVSSGYNRDPPEVAASYNAIPLIEQTILPRGGISMDTQAVGRVQFGIPPETIKDSMRLGLAVPNVYIVPVERFCREMGPALGVNLAEFEFPAYFNFFVYKKQCTLIVDNDEAENNIRRVFNETLFGPSKFRREDKPVPYEEEDFAPDFPREAIPDFTKELRHFRIMPDGKELVLETLLNFCHFDLPIDAVHEDIGVPPPLPDGATVDEVEIAEESIEVMFDIDEDLEEEAVAQVAVPKDLKGIESREEKHWTFFQTRWIPVAVVYPQDATQEQIDARTVKRVEIFKMPGGTEYILHDIAENNCIVGKARFSGHVKVSESMRVDGFGGINIVEEAQDSEEGCCSDDDGVDDDSVVSESLGKTVTPSTFNPPSFGVTVLGNSHGFDKSGSVSGYVLWINGRGVMIDPPPYSSATLEREGIRPRTIVGIILTHCHADHDAGAFQKVLTGSQVVVITTPTIYKSFIRKYAALSALSPALLRHSHRHKPAIIGAPLRFQGATFHFTYTLHTIPCIGFRVEWRGRSMVFTGDHLNKPVALQQLQDQGVLSKARADDLTNLPLQETDLLLHEAGAPPIHTPLEVLLQLPQRVKRRLYVVHTSALPPDCELRVAPTGTAGTIRLDQLQRPHESSSDGFAARSPRKISGSLEDSYSSPWSSAISEYGSVSEDEGDFRLGPMTGTSFVSRQPVGKVGGRSTALGHSSPASPPLVSLRPASSTDAWFILNLLSAVPFLTSLSYASTMELLETARVDAFCKDDIIVPSSRRDSVLCVVWEGTCVEYKVNSVAPKTLHAPLMGTIQEDDPNKDIGAVWYAGDWTGPIALQPEKRLSAESSLSATHDVVAMSSQGVKVITIDIASLHAILKSGSPLYRKYLERRNFQQKVIAEPPIQEDESSSTPLLLDKALRHLNVAELLNSNSAFKKFSAVQKRHLECLAEGPVYFHPGERLWRAGAHVDKAYLIVSGSASFVPKRRNAGSAGVPSFVRSYSSKTSEASAGSEEGNLSQIGERMRLDALAAIKQLGKSATEGGGDDSSFESEEVDKRLLKHSSSSNEGTTHVKNESDSTLSESHSGQQRRPSNPFTSSSSSGHQRVDTYAQCENALAELEVDENAKDSIRPTLSKRRSSRARFANKVLGRLYSRRAYSDGLVFGSGHFLGDVSKMVAGLVTSDAESHVGGDGDGDSSMPAYGFGEARSESKDVVIYEQGAAEHLVHSSTLAAGKEGCVVLVFPKTSLIPFLDEYPGLLLSLLGTQVVV